MKKKNNFSMAHRSCYALSALVLMAVTSQAQQQPATANKPSGQTSTQAQVPYPGLHNLNSNGKFNYIRTILPDQPMQAIPGQSQYYRQTATYFDGLGRPIQTVSRKAHADGNDLVTVNTYDSMGRETYKYQPYAAPMSGVFYSGSAGLIKTNDSTQLRHFYDQNGPDEQPYGKSIFENTTLGRPVKTMSPGAGWVGADRGKTFNYFTNTNWTHNGFTIPRVLTGGFPRWTMAATAGALPVNAGQYAIGQLSITQAKDEDGKETLEMKDKEGRLVMTLSGLTTNGWGLTSPLDYAYTCYIYDELGRLRCVLPPEAAKPVAADAYGSANWNAISQQQLDGLCYTYRYDARGRMIEKKLPGKAVEYNVYDKRDRLIMFQDGNLRNAPDGNPRWRCTFYDALDRPVMSAICKASEGREAMAGLIEDNAVWPATHWLYYFKNYNLLYTYPTALVNTDILSYTYYDNYNQTDGVPGLQFDPVPFNGLNLPVTVIPSVKSNDPRGITTGSKVRVVDGESGVTNQWLTTAMYYDEKGRLIQSVSQNIQGDVEVSSNVYYFQGMIYKNILTHRNHRAVQIPGATEPAITEFKVVNTLERNLAPGGGNDLIKRHTQKINNGNEYELLHNSYDHNGRNTLKQWTAGLCLTTYNMRGFQDSIIYRKNDLDTGFYEALFYDKGFATKLYNGNLAGITWAGADHRNRAYGYSYDALNRLTHAEFNQKNIVTGVWDKSEGFDFSMTGVTYDLNGNIQTMNQYGRAALSSSGSVQMDALTFTYAPGGNQLFNVRDAMPTYTNLPDFKEAVSNPASVKEYDFDDNGNMTRDDNKGIGSIRYTDLNKPGRITVDNKGTVSYAYDATGNKLRKITIDAGTGLRDTTDYMGNFIYKNNELQYILNDEGRARPVVVGHADYPSQIPQGTFLTKFKYDYFVKDHQGNVRSTVTAEPNAYSYLAMHNISTANIEELIFDNISMVRDTKPGSTNPDDMAARLNGGEDGKRIGTAIMLHTSPGDRFDISVKSFYDGEYTQEGEQVAAQEMVNALLNTLMGGNTMGGQPVSELDDNQQLIQNVFSDPDLANQLEAITESNNFTGAPKAHLNYLWFDNNLKLQAGSSGSTQVTQVPNSWNTISPIWPGGTTSGNGSVINYDGTFVAPTTGVLIVYIDNQSIGKDVWFDNLSISTYQSNILEEDHYYPFGLTLSTTPLQSGIKEQNYKSVTKELEKKYDLNMYDFSARTKDMTLPVWGQEDVKSEKYYSTSPYAYCGNNPVNFIDKNGEDYFYLNDNGACVAHIKTTSNTDIYYKISDDNKVTRFRELSKVGPYPDGKGVEGNAYARLTDKQKINNIHKQHWYFGPKGSNSFHTNINPVFTNENMTLLSLRNVKNYQTGAVVSEDAINKEAKGNQNTIIAKWNAGTDANSVITITAGMPINPTDGSIERTVTSGSPLPTPAEGEVATVDPSTRFTPWIDPHDEPSKIETVWNTVSVEIVDEDGKLIPTSQQRNVVKPKSTR